MSKFTQVEVRHDIILNDKVVAHKGTKGIILDIKENNLHFVRFTTGRMLTVSSRYLTAL